MNVVGKEWQPNKPCTLCRNWNGDVLSLCQGVAVIRCRGCGLYYVDSVPLTGAQEEAQGKIDLERGPTYLNEVYGSKGSQWARYYSEWLRRIGTFTSGRRLLDVGCGVGQFVRIARDLGWDAYGIDNSLDTISHGRRVLNLGDYLVVGSNLSEVSFSDDFDVVTLFSVIEHVEDPFALLSQVKRNLKPNGIVLIKTPSQDSLVTKLHWVLSHITGGKVDLGLYNRDHIYRFSKRTLRLLLAKIGFELEQCYFDDHLWITATRYLLYRNLRILKFLALGAVIMTGKLVRMDNQLVMIARLPIHKSDRQSQVLNGDNLESRIGEL